MNSSWLQLLVTAGRDAHGACGRREGLRQESSRRAWCLAGRWGPGGRGGAGRATDIRAGGQSRAAPSRAEWSWDPGSHCSPPPRLLLPGIAYSAVEMVLSPAHLLPCLLLSFTTNVRTAHYQQHYMTAKLVQCL